MPHVEDKCVLVTTEAEEHAADPSAAVASSPRRRPLHENSRVEMARKAGTIVVFFSSTFRDFQEERNQLQRWVLPKLRQLCAQRGMFLVPVDLRWGVTEEQTQSFQTIRHCLSEISRSTYFVGMYAERYGWHQHLGKPQDELLANTFAAAEPYFPWLKNYLDRSITELEYRHGALIDPKANRPTSLFYFRSPHFLDGVDHRDRADFESETPDAKRKLQSLKAEVKQAGFKVVEGYKDVPTLAQRVLDDLTTLIERDFPGIANTDRWARERDEQQAFLESRCRLYVERPGSFDAITRSLNKDRGRPLYLYAKSGCGKTAFVANWIKRRQQLQLDEFLFLHFIGSSNDSCYPSSIVRQFFAEAAAAGSDSAESVVKSNLKDEEVLLAFQSSLLAIQQDLTRPLLIVLDALDQIVVEGGTTNRFGWLPRVTPKHVRLLCTSTDGPSQDHVRQLGWKEHELLPLSETERLPIAKAYLYTFGRTFSDSQLELLKGSPGCSNYLFLKLVLDELMVQATFEKLQEILRNLLACQMVSDLYHQILQRLESHHPAVQPLLSYVYRARFGLSESEMKAFTGLENKHSEWLQLQSAVGEYLINRRGLYTFFHKSLAEAVSRKYNLQDDCMVH